LNESQLTLPVSEERDHIRGPASAAVTLVEYGRLPALRAGALHPERLLAGFPEDATRQFVRDDEAF
jgi:hypothetical protein